MNLDGNAAEFPAIVFFLFPFHSRWHYKGLEFNLLKPAGTLTFPGFLSQSHGLGASGAQRVVEGSG